MTAPLTLEPLSQAHLPEVSALWADPAVIRYTNITAPARRQRPRTAWTAC